VSNVYFDRSTSDDERRRALYAGDIFVYSPLHPALELCELARTLLERAFEGLDPRQAQHHLPVETYVAILAKLKPEFIHHPRCKELLPRLLVELGCDPEQTYFDVPRMRTSTSGRYLTTGIAYAFHPHRDTWYSAPLCQLNWWLPVYETTADNGMAFHPQHWSTPLRNGSARYNYQDWVATSRFSAASHVGKDVREQPHAEEPAALEPQLRVVTPVGGVMIFSAAQLHSSVQNDTGETRFSLDFRTVHLDDAVHAAGAHNLDSSCTGTTMGDYLRCTDLAHLPDGVIKQYWNGHPQPAKLATATP
jgi:hypothetical protein